MEPDPVGEAPTTSEASPTGPTLPPETTLAIGSTAGTTTPPEPSAYTGDIVGYDLMTIQLNGEDLLVAIADNNALRARGLMGVTEFGDLDGMVFAWPEPHIGTFWMWTVPIALDVAFFNADGSLIDVLEMAPCMDGNSFDCPRYQPSVSYVYALERQAGRLVTLPDNAILDIDPGQLFQQ